MSFQDWILDVIIRIFVKASWDYLTITKTQSFSLRDGHFPQVGKPAHGSVLLCVWSVRHIYFLFTIQNLKSKIL